MKKPKLNRKEQDFLEKTHELDKNIPIFLSKENLQKLKQNIIFADRNANWTHIDDMLNSIKKNDSIYKKDISGLILEIAGSINLNQNVLRNWTKRDKESSIIPKIFSEEKIRLAIENIRKNIWEDEIPYNDFKELLKKELIGKVSKKEIDILFAYDKV